MKTLNIHMYFHLVYSNQKCNCINFQSILSAINIISITKRRMKKHAYRITGFTDNKIMHLIY